MSTSTWLSSTCTSRLQVLQNGTRVVLEYKYKYQVLHLCYELLLPPPRRLCFCQTLFVCLSVCRQDNSKSYGRIFLKFWGHVRNGNNYQWFNFGGDPEGILDSGSLWNFRYHCFQWGIRQTAAKSKMVLPPSEQHGLGGGVRALTAF